MRLKIVAFALALAVTQGATPALARVQVGSDTWVLVKTVPVGDTLTVKLKNGKSVGGEKQETTDEGLGLLRMGRVIQIKRSEISKVYHHMPDESDRPGPRGMGGATLGALAGLLAFAVLNAGDSGRGRDEQRRYTRATALLIPAGAAAGFVIERGVSKALARDLIYEAP